MPPLFFADYKVVHRKKHAYSAIAGHEPCRH